MQDPKKPKKKRMYRLVDDPIPTDPDEFETYMAGDYDSEPFLDYWNRKGAQDAIEGVKARAREKEEKRKKQEEEAKRQAAKASGVRSAYKGSVTQKADATAKRVR